MNKLSQMKIGVIIQARTGSTRFPKKILQKLPFKSEITILENVFYRLKLSKKIHEIIVATTTEPEDDIIIKIAEKNKISSFRGSTNDVLSRYYNAAKKFDLDIVIRVTSDCPCIDPKLVDRLISLYLEGKHDYICVDVNEYPRGLDAEIFNMNVFEEVFQNANDSYDREHVTHYIYSNPQKYSIHKMSPDKFNEWKDKKTIRITVDTIYDYISLCAVFDLLHDTSNYTVDDIYNVYDNHSWLYLINQTIRQKRKYTGINDELEDAITLLKINELKKSALVLEHLQKNEKGRED